MLPQNPFIIIVNYKSGHHLTGCVRSVFESRDITLPHENVIIVDNASGDASLEQCRIKYPRLSYIYNTENVGFATGANIGARRALEKGADIIFFINPDARVDSDCITQMTRTLKIPSVGAVAPIIYEPDHRTIWFAGGKIDYKRMRAYHTTKLPEKTITDTDYLTGCVLAIKKDVFAKTGLFDERFFLYYEDADLSVRMRKDGYRTVIDRNAHATHAEVSENNKKQKTYFLVLMGLLFFKTHTPIISRPRFYSFFLLRRIWSILQYIRRKPLSDVVYYAFNDYAKSKNTNHFLSHRQL